MTLNQEYIKLWVEWFMVQQDEQGMEREVRDSLEQCIGMFFASQAAFELHTKNVNDKRIKCPKCQGRGHSNLFLAGDTKPQPCKNCEGTGRVIVGVAE